VSEHSGTEYVPAESYVPDGESEEERIMDERAACPRTLDSETLRVPIETLKLPLPVVSSPSATITEAIALMQKNRVGALLLVDGKGRLAGIFTERDVILKVAGRGLDVKRIPVAGYMTARPETLPSHANLAFALNMMTLGGYRHVPIVDRERRPVALVSMADVVRYLSSFFQEDVLNLPPRPELLHPDRREGG